MQTKNFYVVWLFALAFLTAGFETAYALPDVLPQNVSLSTATVTAGGTLTVTFDIRNQGTTSAVATTTRLRLNQSSTTTGTGDTSLGDVSTPSIAAGGVASGLSKVVTIPSGTPAGTYYIWIVADNGSVLTQSNYNNDYAHSSALTVTVVAQQPDVLPQNISLSASSVEAGGTLTVTFDIRNQGTGNAIATTTRLRLNQSSSTTSTSDTSLGDVSTPAISANSSASGLSKLVTIPAGTAAGTYYIWVVADNGSVLTQPNYNNDYAHAPALTVTVTAQKPDVLPQNVSLSLTSVQAGGTLTVTFDIRNQGGGNAVATTSRLRLNQSSSTTSPADASIGDVSTPAINANSTATGLSKLVTIPADAAAGTYYIWVVADNGSVLSQSDVNNDYARSAAFTVTVTPQLPDVLPQNVSLSSGSVQAGGSLTVTFDILNQGAGSAIATTTRLRLNTSSTTTSPSDISLGDVSTPAISANSSASGLSKLVTIPAGVSAGTYYIWFVADNGSVLTQSNPNNDYAHSSSLTVSAIQQCDVLVQGTPSITPNTVSPGGSISVGYVIHNNGPADAGPSQTKINVKNSSGAIITAPTFSAPSVSTSANSANQSSVVQIPAGTPVGTYRAFVILDNQSALNQSSSANDFAPGVTFVVQNTAVAKPDLAFQNTPVVSPTTLLPGDSTLVSFTVINQGTASAPASKTKVWIKNNAGQVLDSKVIDTQALAVGASVPQQVTLTIPTTTPAGICSAQVILDNAIPGLDQLNEDNDYSQKINVSVGTSTPVTPPSGYVEGIDFRGASIALDWSVASGAGIKFAYFKTTEATYDFSQQKIDTLNNNITGASSQSPKIAVGAFHFATPLFSSPYHETDYEAPTTAVAEADHFYQISKSIIGTGFLPPALDIEDQPVLYNNDNTVAIWVNVLNGYSYYVDNNGSHSLNHIRPSMDPAALANWIRAWVSELKKLADQDGKGVEPVVYCNQDYAGPLSSELKSEINLWVADIGAAKGNPSTAGWGSWVVHQYSQNASRTWGAGNQDVTLDLDVLNGTLDQLLTPSVQLGARGRVGFNQQGFCIEVTGNNSETLMLQKSSNCIDWTDANSVELLNGAGTFTDGNANSTPTQFYRVKPPQ